MRFAHRSAGDACEAAAVDEFKRRVVAGRLQRAVARSNAALRSLRSARAAVALMMGGADAVVTKRLHDKLAAVAEARAALSKQLAALDGQGAFFKDSV
eukprot:4719713-Prymnesium_polylepis.1